MSSIPIGGIIVLILFGSAMLVMLGARFLPEHHLSDETRSVVSVSTAVVGTLSALVVGLLISTANASFTAKAEVVTGISANLISLDRVLRRMGPEAQDMRVLLQRYTAAMHEDLFPDKPGEQANLENDATISMLEQLQDKVLALAPANETQRWLQTQALQLTQTVIEARWKLGQENATRSPRLLFVLVMFWFMLIFASFGLFAPCNAMAITAILLCAVGIGSAIRMTTELQTPFSGLIRISSGPLTQAVAVISRN